MFGRYRTENDIVLSHLKKMTKCDCLFKDAKGDFCIDEEKFISYLKNVQQDLIDKVIDKMIETIEEQRMNAELSRQREKIIKEKIAPFVSVKDKNCERNSFRIVA